jgi:hypothetical protein
MPLFNALRVPCQRPYTPAALGLEGLIRAGVLGLLEAIQHYDPAQAARFQTYAACRIQEAMRAYGREWARVPRAVREQALTQALRTTCCHHGRNAWTGPAVWLTLCCEGFRPPLDRCVRPVKCSSCAVTLHWLERRFWATVTQKSVGQHDMDSTPSQTAWGSPYGMAPDATRTAGHVALTPMHNAVIGMRLERPFEASTLSKRAMVGKRGHVTLQQ